MRTLVLLRHGESVWNSEGLFTGWVDVGLSDKGRKEAESAGTLLRDAGLTPSVVHTSVLTRAIQTAERHARVGGPAVASGAQVLAAERAPLRRAAGEGQGADAQGVRRRAVHALAAVLRRAAAAAARQRPFSQAADPRYAALPPELLPRTECLKDVLGRLLPYWHDAIIPDLLAGQTVLVVAHGNSLRALVKHLDGISDEDISGLNIPTGIPLAYELDDAFRPVTAGGRYLDPQAAAEAAEAVRNQGR